MLSDKALEKYGDPKVNPGVNMCLYRPSAELMSKIKCLPAKIYCNKDMAGRLADALILVCERGLENELKTYHGCYNVRSIRGVPGKWSTHSWGLSIDFNKKGNELRAEPQMHPDIVACFKESGFDWGGDFKRKDGMHFQLKEI